MTRRALTLAGEQRLREVARMKLQIPRSKTLACELDVSQSYVRQLLSRMMRELAENVPRGTEQMCDDKRRQHESTGGKRA